MRTSLDCSVRHSCSVLDTKVENSYFNTYLGFHILDNTMFLTLILSVTLILVRVGEVVECNHLQLLNLICAACGCSNSSGQSEHVFRNRTSSIEREPVKLSDNDINQPSKSDWLTSLHVAALDGDAQSVEELLAKGAIVDLPNKEGLTALHLAATKNHQDVIGVLLRHGANVNARTCNGSTILHLLALNDNLPAVQYILGTGKVMVSVRDNDMETPLDIASQLGFTDVGLALQQKIAELDTALIKAAEEGLLGNVTKLISQGASVNAFDSSRVTPLHNAVRHGHLDLVNHLIRMGANINSQTENGWSPLHLAIQQGHRNVIDTLMKQSNIHINS